MRKQKKGEKMVAPILWTIGLIILGVSGYAATCQYFNKFSRNFKIFLWIVSTIVVIFWFLYHFVVFHVIGMVWVIRIMTHLRIEFTAFFVGIFSALIQIRTNAQRPLRGFFSRHNGAVLTAFLIMPVYINSILFPIKTPFANEWKDGICIQTTGESCGPACVATILKMHGIETTEEKVSRDVFCSERGSEMWTLGRYLEKHGLKVSVVPTSDKPFDPPVPSIAGVGLGGKDGISHAIIILDKTTDSFTIVDPMAGRFVWSKDKTWENYYFFGFLLHIKGFSK